MDTKLVDNVFWVGHIDWAVRDFHGYTTSRGSTYNAYLVLAEKAAIIDTVKGAYVGSLLENVKAKVPLEKIDYIVCNHAEPDLSLIHI